MLIKLLIFIKMGIKEFEDIMMGLGFIRISDSLSYKYKTEERRIFIHLTMGGGFKMYRCFIKIDFTKTFKYFDIDLEKLPIQTLLLNVEDRAGNIDITNNLRKHLRDKKIGEILE